MGCDLFIAYFHLKPSQKAEENPFVRMCTSVK